MIHPPKSFAAKYRGTCSESGRAILPGDRVAYSPRTKQIILLETKGSSDRVDIFVIGDKEYTRNARGRCEDAPCCGCCTI